MRRATAPPGLVNVRVDEEAVLEQQSRKEPLEIVEIADHDAALE